MDPILTQEQINEIAARAPGNLENDTANRFFINYMTGYIRFADDLEKVRQFFFTELKKLLPAAATVADKQERFNELWEKWRRGTSTPEERKEMVQMQVNYWAEEEKRIKAEDTPS